MNWKRVSATLVLALAAVVSAYGQGIIPIEAWTIDLADTKPSSKNVNITRGSSRYLQPTVNYGTAAWTFPTSGVTVTMRYKSSDMTNAWYQTAGEALTPTAGVLRVLWTPTNEATARAYSFEIEASTGAVAQISLKGTIFLDSALNSYGAVTSPTNYSPWTSGDTNEAALRLAGDLAGSNNVTVSVAAETTNRIAGDLAGSNNVTATRAWATNLFVRVTNISVGVWGFLLPGE